MMTMNRRHFLRLATSGITMTALPSALTGCNSSSSSSTPPPPSPNTPPALSLQTTINGDLISRAEVLEWEARRIQIVVDRMAHNYPQAVAGELAAATIRPATDISNIDAERDALADAKIEAGEQAMRDLLAQDVLVTTPFAEAAASSGAGWVKSEIEIVTNRGTAERFSNWFDSKVFSSDQRPMLVACPDHYVLNPVYPNGQFVLETTGGASLASQFTIDYDDTKVLPVERNNNFPVQYNGAAVNENGTVIGGTNHMIRTLDQGIHGRLIALFPASLPGSMIEEHRWHLACEWGNWIRQYIAETLDF